MTAALTIPVEIRRSSLMERGGFAVVVGLLGDETLSLLLRESLECLSTADLVYASIPDREDVRGGNPARRLRSASGGAVQRALYGADEMVRMLRQLTGIRTMPTGQAATYSYYLERGDHLDLHRDIETCDVVVITTLCDHGSADSADGALCLYPSRWQEKLSAIRASPDNGAVGVRLNVGDTIVMLGGIVPHALLPVSERQQRIVSVLCYRAM